MKRFFTVFFIFNLVFFVFAQNSNTARKIVGKKQMSKIPELRDKVLNQAASPCLGNYIWKCGVGPQMGYSFSVVMALTHLTCYRRGN